MSYSVIKRDFKKKKNDPKNNKNEKGNWEYSRFQKNENDINEQFIKSKCFKTSFNHHKIENMMYPKETLEQQLMAKKNKGLKLKSDERIKLENIISKKQNEIKNDNLKIDKFGLNAKDINTDEGRIKMLLLVAEKKIDENNNNIIYYLSQKLSEFNIPKEILKDNAELFTKINNIVSKLDKINLQFNDFHSNMPPLNEKGFTKLDDFQRDVISNINNNISTIVQAPTSSGKSILTGYLYTKANNKVLVVVPTDILAWQMASMIGNIINKDIPIITETFQSSPKRDVLLEKIHKVGIIVGTPTYLLDFLPLVKINFDWLVIDEIHMIGHKDCYEMELIAKAYSHINILALSATIGNVEYLKNWFNKIGYDNINVVKCDKRFFNLQQYYYENNNIHRIHPLSMININSFYDKSILEKNINITPPDIWDLSLKIFNDKDLYDTHKLYIYNYFDQDERITLDKTNAYFKELLKYMVSNIDKSNIKDIINEYKNVNVDEKEDNLINLSFCLKRENKTPAIIFNSDTFKCLEMIKIFSSQVKELENKKYPNLYKDRLKMNARSRSIEKKKDKMKIDEMGEKKLMKAMMSGELEIFESSSEVSINEPHKDFIFTKNQKISQYDIERYFKDFGKYFPMTGVEYHYIIDLLWRGVGVYVKGLPDPYLRVVQNLACNGELAIVFSDTSLVFGVSMPFRTTVITNDNIDSMMYHQMAGRAGRRGLDKEGNVVFINNSWDNIMELSTSKIPFIEGSKNNCYGINIGKQLSELNDYDNYILWDKIKINNLNETFVNNTFEYDFCNTNDIPLNHMMWKLRKTDDCYRYPFLINYIRKLFANVNPVHENNQINFAHFMLNYSYIRTTNDDNKLTLYEPSIKFNIKEHMNNYNLNVPDNIDPRIFLCIRVNKLLFEKDYKLRDDIINFSENIKHLQHFFFHKKEINLTRLIGKLLTRIWWIYHSSSPLMV